MLPPRLVVEGFSGGLPVSSVKAVDRHDLAVGKP